MLPNPFDPYCNDCQFFWTLQHPNIVYLFCIEVMIFFSYVPKFDQHLYYESTINIKYHTNLFLRMLLFNKHFWKIFTPSNCRYLWSSYYSVIEYRIYLSWLIKCKTILWHIKLNGGWYKYKMADDKNILFCLLVYVSIRNFQICI